MNATAEDINATLVDCNSGKVIVENSLLSQNQRVILTVLNTLLMLGNIIANSLVLYTLIKTKQIRNVTCKLIFVISVSDTMQGIFLQNLYTGFLFENLCSAVRVFLFISVFFLHMSVYIIAVLGIDRYLRIKQPVKFKAFWKTKTVFALISIATFISFLQALLPVIGLLVEIQFIVSLIYYLIDGSFLVATIVLQLLTIRTSNAIHKDSKIDAADKTNKVITKLCMRIMLLLCFFFVPYQVMYILRTNIQSKLNDHGKSMLEFSTSISVLFCFSNSFANAVLFLMTNKKAKRILRKTGTKI